jgi:hypothetical protein
MRSQTKGSLVVNVIIEARNPLISGLVTIVSFLNI